MQVAPHCNVTIQSSVKLNCFEVSDQRYISLPKLAESESGQMVLEKVKWVILLYIYSIALNRLNRLEYDSPID